MADSNKPDYPRQFAQQGFPYYAPINTRQPPGGGASIPQTQMDAAPHGMMKDPGVPPGPSPTPTFPASQQYQQWLQHPVGQAPTMPGASMAPNQLERQQNVPQDVQAMQQGMIYGPGPVRGKLNLLPQYQNLGAIRPFGPGEWIQRSDGKWSSEETTSVQFNNGKWAVVPTLWMVNGQAMTLDEDTAAQYAQQSGLNWPMFNTENEANAWSDQREQRWQQVPVGRSDMQPPLWSRQFPPRQQ